MWIDVELRRAIDLVFDGVLHRHDLHAGLIQAGERAVQRRGLARPGRTGHEDDAVRLPNQPLEPLERGTGHAELAQVADPRAAIQDAEHDTLAVERGTDRHAQVELSVRQPESNAPDLG